MSVEPSRGDGRRSGSRFPQHAAVPGKPVANHERMLQGYPMGKTGPTVVAAYFWPDELRFHFTSLIPCQTPTGMAAAISLHPVGCRGTVLVTLSDWTVVLLADDGTVRCSDYRTSWELGTARLHLSFPFLSLVCCAVCCCTSVLRYVPNTRRGALGRWSASPGWVGPMGLQRT